MCLCYMHYKLYLWNQIITKFPISICEAVMQTCISLPSETQHYKWRICFHNNHALCVLATQILYKGRRDYSCEKKMIGTWVLTAFMSARYLHRRPMLSNKRGQSTCVLTSVLIENHTWGTAWQRVSFHFGTLQWVVYCQTRHEHLQPAHNCNDHVIVFRSRTWGCKNMDREIKSLQSTQEERKEVPTLHEVKFVQQRDSRC